MLLEIRDGTVRQGGEIILSHFDFHIRGTEKIAIVGRNGAGKTTLLKALSGKLPLETDPSNEGSGLFSARKITIEMLEQKPVRDPEETVEDCVLGTILKHLPGDALYDRLYDRTRFDAERKFLTAFTRMGFAREDAAKKLGAFSGGEQTRIMLLATLLEEPDVLLLDEPTNHLDVAACEWLEDEIRRYPNAVVMVSHDRFFMDQTAEEIYEVSRRSARSGGMQSRNTQAGRSHAGAQDSRVHGDRGKVAGAHGSGTHIHSTNSPDSDASYSKVTLYHGNYTHYRAEKAAAYARQCKIYEAQQAELAREQDLIRRFKHKPTKAAFARSRGKLVSRMELVDKPVPDDAVIHTGEILPAKPGPKNVVDCEHLIVGYDKEKPLRELSFRIRRGQKIGIFGPNGTGKTAFLKTIAGQIPAIKGKLTVNENVEPVYFDQLSAQITSDKTVYDWFHDQFPVLTGSDVRAYLAGFLFRAEDFGKKVSNLSGGERARLVLAAIFERRPNFLLLDEPTNNMDIPAKETLESIFRAYKGTILFVSHDRYFLSQVAESLLLFEPGTQAVQFYPFGYAHYCERRLRRAEEIRSGKTPEMLRTAEEQRLIEGLRSVPRPEHPRLREIPTAEAQVDWELRLAEEEIARAEEAYFASLEQEAREKEREYLAYVTGAGGETVMNTAAVSDTSVPVAAERPATVETSNTQITEPSAISDAEAALKNYTDACLAWYDVWQETRKARRLDAAAAEEHMGSMKPGADDAPAAAGAGENHEDLDRKARTDETERGTPPAGAGGRTAE